MSVINNKTFLLGFLSILSFNLVLSYPEIQGNQFIYSGGDSSDYFSQSSTISSNGDINWLLTFQSLYGYYPPYAEVGLPILYASISVISENLILSSHLLTVCWSVMFMLFIAVFTHRFISRDKLVICISTLFVNSIYI